MPPTSAGLLMYRMREDEPQFFLVHPGGPFWKNKDTGAWTIPKGGLNPGENELAGAIREFQEETGLEPSGPFLPLRSIRQRSGKIVHAWAFCGDCDPATIRSINYDVEWPPRSGRFGSFPEVDKAAFFSFTVARMKINEGQIPLLEELREKLDTDGAAALPDRANII